MVVRVGKDVFPPDIGFTTQVLAEVLLKKKALCALDMGTGTLILALLMRKAGIQHVWAVDNHLPAIECARSNLERNPRLQPIEIIRSDLFTAIPAGQLFDLIVFNQPYYPIRGRKIAGLGEDGGSSIINRFFNGAASRLTQNGELVMPYSTIAGASNDPRRIARSLGWAVSIIKAAVSDENQHRIYSIRLGSQLRRRHSEETGRS